MQKVFNITKKQEEDHEKDFNSNNFIIDDFVKSHQIGRHKKKLQMQGARILRNETYIEVRRNDEG